MTTTDPSDNEEYIEPLPLKPKPSTPLSNNAEIQISIAAFKPKRETGSTPALNTEDSPPKTRFDIPLPDPAPKPLRWPVYLSIALMLMIAFLWFAYLKERTQNRPDPLEKTTHAGSTQTSSTPQAIESPEEKKSREAALQAQAEYRFTKGTWDYRKAANWSVSAYTTATHRADQALEAFDQKAYAPASNFYHQAIIALESIEQEQPVAVSNLIHQAREAFAEKDFEQARTLLDLALTLDPEQPFAQRLLKRAKAGPEVVSLLNRGAEHEKGERWSLAHADYQEAVQRDAESGEARTAFNRIKEHMADSGFQRLMSQGLSEFAQGNHTNALVHFIKAKAYRPESSEAKDAIVQVKDAIRREHLEQKRKNAVAFEAEEAWAKALAVYMDVLAHDPSVEFARQGRLRTTQQRDLTEILEGILKHPDSLLERKGQQHAYRVLTEIKALPFKGKQLILLASKVEALLEALRKPIEITITSDGTTQVSLYKVGRFGPLTTKLIELTPGKYTVVGARAGYRDVRIDFVLKPGSSPRAVEVICRDKI